MSDQNYQHKQIYTVTRCFTCVTCSREIHQLLLHCGLQAGCWALLRGELRDVIVHEVVHESLGTCRREFIATLMKLIMIAMCFKLISSLAQSHTHRRFPFHVPANESNQQNIVATMGNKTTKSLKYWDFSSYELNVLGTTWIRQKRRSAQSQLGAKSCPCSTV